MLRTLRIAPLLAALILGACSSPSDPEDGGALTAHAWRDGLLLHNRTARPIYFFAVEGAYAARINWAPCTDPDACAHVPARGLLAVDRDRIAGYHAGAREAIVYWWYLVPGIGDGPHVPVDGGVVVVVQLTE